MLLTSDSIKGWPQQAKGSRRPTSTPTATDTAHRPAVLQAAPWCVFATPRSRPGCPPCSRHRHQHPRLAFSSQKQPGKRARGWSRGRHGRKTLPAPSLETVKRVRRQGALLAGRYGANVRLENGMVETERPDGMGSRPKEREVRLSLLLSEVGRVAQMESEACYPADSRPRLLMGMEQRWLRGYCLCRLPW